MCQIIHFKYNKVIMTSNTFKKNCRNIFSKKMKKKIFFCILVNNYPIDMKIKQFRLYTNHCKFDLWVINSLWEADKVLKKFFFQQKCDLYIPNPLLIYYCI